MCCIDDGPVEGDRFSENTITYQTDMMHAPCANPGGCCIACLFPCCFAMMLRKDVLDGNMEEYSCCQGYYNCCCIKEGTCQGSSAGLCCEAFCCLSLAVSSTRIYLMDKKNLHSDPCDRRIIRFNNCMQMLSCFCHIAACFIDGLDQCARYIDHAADIVFCVTQSCMQAQVHHELKMDEQTGVGPDKQMMA